MFKPMLAATIEDVAKDVRFPAIVSAKFDGVRAVVIGGVVLSRSLKPIPNAYVQKLFGNKVCEGYDGELICGSPTHKDTFRTTTSAVMREEGEPDVKFYVFDHFLFPQERFSHRWLQSPCHNKNTPRVEFVGQFTCYNADELSVFETAMLNMGHEGVMVRDPNGKYKFGRSTAKEGYLLKLKRFADSEATVIGFEELMHNGNVATTNALGRTERSSHKDNFVGKGTLGCLVVKDVKSGVEFSVGTGFDDAERSRIWDDCNNVVGRVICYKYFPSGSKDKPRFPVFKGFRDERDM